MARTVKGLCRKAITAQGNASQLEGMEGSRAGGGEVLRDLLEKRCWGCVLLFAVACGLFLCLPVGLARAEEPFEDLIKKLKDERLFDLALVYVDTLENNEAVSKQLRKDLELEKAVLLYQSAMMMRVGSPEKANRLDVAEAALRSFVNQNPQHPKKSSARLKLATLLYDRAAEAKSTGEPGKGNSEAVAAFDKAHALFESALKELTQIYEGIKGNRTDLNDAKAVQYRKSIQVDIREAQLLSANAIEQRGLARAPDSPEQKKDLQTALSQYQSLYSKAGVGVKNLALFNRSRVQSKLGMVDDAIDGFQRVVDAQNQDFLRPLQTQAVTELVDLLGGQKKFKLANDFGKRWLSQLVAGEKRWAETNMLRLAYARNSLVWAEELAAADPRDRVAIKLKTEARSELRGLFRIRGAHSEATRELLAKLGADPAAVTTAKLPTVTSFEEAFTEAQKRIDEATRLGVEIESLEDQIGDPNTSGSAKDELKQGLASTEEAIATNRKQAMQLLRTGLAKFKSDDDRRRLTEARFRLAFLSLKEGRSWDAIVLGEFLTRNNPGSELGLNSAAMALAAYGDLLQTAADDDSLIEQLAPLATFLSENWADSDEAARAAEVVVQKDIAKQNWERIDDFLSKLPADARQRLQRVAGVSAYVEFLNATKDENLSKAELLKPKALNWLTKSIAGLVKTDLDRSSIDSINALARLYLIDEKPGKASELLLGDKPGLIQELEKRQDLVPANVGMESYSSAIRTIVGRMVRDQIPADQAVEQMKRFVGRLQELAAKSPSGSKALAGIYYQLAKDLKDSLADTTEPGKRRRLSEAMLLVVAEAGNSDSFSTRYWAVDTIVAVADEISNEKSSKQKANEAYQTASKMLSEILAREQAEPGWIQPEGFDVKVKMQLAKVESGLGQHQKAVLLLGNILDEKNLLLDVQIQVAKILQKWGAVDPKFHKSAIMGGRPKGGRNIIWGWGKIQKMTANNPSFKTQFFEARYELARSRFLYAKSLAGDSRGSEIRKASKDITATAANYPELGGVKQRQKFDALLRLIQKELGEPPTGLKPR